MPCKGRTKINAMKLQSSITESIVMRLSVHENGEPKNQFGTIVFV